MLSSGELISVVIPVYNSEKYILNQLKSLDNQTYQNFEIIIAFDSKTTDNSLNIIYDFKTLISNRERERERDIYVFIDKDNSPGDARNRGFNYATGDFVAFIDVDDIIHPNYLEYLHDIFVQHPLLDVGFCNISRIEFGMDVPNIFEFIDEPIMPIELYEQEELLIQYIHRELIPTRAAWPYLVRRRYLIENSIQFSENRYGEDQFWVFNVLCNTPKIGFVHNKLYYYVQRHESICHTINWKEKTKAMQDLINRTVPILSKINAKIRDIYYANDTYEILSEVAKNGSYNDIKSYLSKEELRYLQTCINTEKQFLNRKSLGRAIFTKNMYLWYLCINLFDMAYHAYNNIRYLKE